MDSSEICPTEDAVLALLEYLVDPLLPVRSSTKDTPSQSRQQSVAKQMHAVVLLYNYYHRKQNPQQEYLGFESICKLAVVLKPSLLAHMKLMQRPSDTDLDDLEKQLSLVEKTIMDACDISMSLDASKDVPSTEGWSISKVTVFLTDSRKENCWLKFGSITQGVWSVIEKDVDFSNYGSEVLAEGKHINKKKRVTKTPLRDDSVADEVGFQQLAFLAVKEVTGINQSDLTVMESHVLYSLSKEKTTARFYIMQCTQSNYDDVIQIPITDAIDSLQGPLVRRSLGQWMVTPVIEYFHLLPYAGIVSDWLSREVFSNSLHDQRAELGIVNGKSSKRTERPCEPGVHNNGDTSHMNGGVMKCVGGSATTESLKQNNNNECCMNGLSNASKGPHCMDVDDSYMDKCKNIANEVPLDNQEKMMNPCMDGDLNRLTSGGKVEMVDSMSMPCISECRYENVATGNTTCDNISSHQDGISVGDCALVTYQSNSKDLEKLKTTIASKENMLSQTALKVLHSKRDKLTLQLRNIEDEIARCDKDIQTILNGGEDDLALKIESIIEGCNVVSLRSITQERTFQHLEDQCSPQYIKRKRLSEAILNMQNPCQELDNICYENNWILPTYRVSPTNGEFEASVSVNGVDFKCTMEGGLRSTPREARESAAAQILAKLRSMASLAR